MNPLLTMPPGTVISTVGFHGLATHTGIVSSEVDPVTGEQLVIHNARRNGTVEEPVSRFCSGNRPLLVEGFPGRLPPELVVARARSKIGTPWNLFEWNCEDMVNYAHGLRGAPTQVSTWALAFTVIGVLTLALWLAVGRRRVGRTRRA
jgi:hypothetical protein